MILGRSLGRNARRYPDKAAIIAEDGGAMTHRQFAEQAWCIANGLARHRIGKGSRVAIIARNSPDYLCVCYALAAAGAWMVPINVGLKAADIDLRMRHAQIDAVFVSSEFAPILNELDAATRGRLARRVFVLDRPVRDGISLEALVGEGRAVAPDVEISPEDTLYIGYTSGTTGAPKAALISHRAFVVGFLYKSLAYGLNDRDITLNPGPYWHSAPRDFAALGIYLGGTAIVPTQFEPEKYLELVERHRVTSSFVVPTMLQRIIATPGLRNRDVTSLRCLISGGAPLSGGIKDQILSVFGPVLSEFYGATETRIITAISAVELAARDRSVGRPVHDVELRVLDERGNDLATGQVGEVFLRGPGLFSGYWQDPERTAAAHRGSWFSLGDLGRLDHDGYLYLVDRKQDMIISGGENIYPNDVEECLQRHDGVKEAAAVGAPDEQWGELVVAYVVREGGATPMADELINFCGERLPNYMKPRRIVFCDELPRNSTGKLLRRDLRERENSARDRSKLDPCSC